MIALQHFEQKYGMGSSVKGLEQVAQVTGRRK